MQAKEKAEAQQHEPFAQGPSGGKKTKNRLDTGLSNSKGLVFFSPTRMRSFS